MLAKLAILLALAWDLASARVSAAHWSFADGGPAILFLGTVLAGVIGVVCYLRTTEGLTKASRLILGLLRFVALVCVLLMISGAACTLDLVVPRKPQLLVVLDDSSSMSLPVGNSPRIGTARIALDAGLRQRLAKQYAIDEVSTSSFVTGPQAAQDLAKALILSSASRSDQPPDQILLISDGVELGGRPLEAAARELPAPVSVLMAGDPSNIKDLILQRLYAPSFAYAHDRAMVSAQVRSIGIEGDATISLMSVANGVEIPVASTTVKLTPGVEPSLARLEFQTPDPGLDRYVVKVAPKPGELTELNNTASFNLDVRPEKIKLLMVEGEPSWEYRDIKQAMESDPVLQFHGLVRLPEQEWFYQGPDKRADGKAVIREPTKGFPGSSDELNYFDVVIFGDIDRKLLDQLGRFDMLDSFVKTHAGGLVTIGGFHVYTAGNYDQTPLARMLPFDLSPEKKTQLINRFNVQVTTQGMMHPVMQLEYDPQKNQEAWNNLPWVEGGNAITSVKPGATLLLTHPTLKTKAGPRPIAAAWQYGRGRVISSALDGTWHWRLGRKTEQDYHQRFWGLVARWLAGDPRVNKPFGDLVAQTPAMEAGVSASFFTMIRDSDGNPRTDATAEFLVEGPGGSRLIGRSASDPRLPGRFGFTFTPETQGDYSVLVTITTAGGDVNTQKRTYYVGPSRAEFLRPVPDHAALRALAKATGGSAATVADAASLSLPEGVPTLAIQTSVVSLWQAPGLYLILLLCLISEWLMRKRRGLS